MTGVYLGLDQTDEPVTISALEFDVLWEHCFGPDEVSGMPLVLKVPSPGRTHAERSRLVSQAWAGLEQRGLGRSVDLDPRLEVLLGLLRRPEREIDGRLWAGRSLRLLAAATGEQAVLAVLSGDALTLRFAEVTGLPRYALSVLPAQPAGPGQSITMRTADFEAAAQQATDKTAFEAALRDHGVRAEDATALVTMIGDIVNQGQFGSAARDKLGRRVRADRVLSFFDTQDGRYLQIRRETNGELWTTISPADQRRMLQHLTDLHEEATS
jgi:ESX secretion-associated protein EspG